MRAAGYTYREIGEKLGVSKQRANELVRSAPGTWLHIKAMQEIPYIGLREWMIANVVSTAKLSELCGRDVRRAVCGGGCNKDTIDAILCVTGLDYETCFKENPAEVG
jgi:hypothetical protein